MSSAEPPADQLVSSSSTPVLTQHQHHHQQLPSLSSVDPVKAMATSLESANLQRLLQSSAVFIAEMFLSVGQYAGASYFLVLSKRPISDVLTYMDFSTDEDTAKATVTRSSSVDGEATLRARGLLAYLDRILFDPRLAPPLPPGGDGRDVSNRILKVINIIILHIIITPCSSTARTRMDGCATSSSTAAWACTTKSWRCSCSSRSTSNARP